MLALLVAAGLSLNDAPDDTEAREALAWAGDQVFELLKHGDCKKGRGGTLAPEDGGCELSRFGSGYGAHSLCRTPPYTAPRYKGKKFALSYGISHDFSFDVDLANRTNLYVMAFDPTVSHPAKMAGELLPVFFQAWGAPGPHFKSNWIKAPPAKLSSAMGWDVKVVKMDCEGVP